MSQTNQKLFPTKFKTCQENSLEPLWSEIFFSPHSAREKTHPKVYMNYAISLYRFTNKIEKLLQGVTASRREPLKYNHSRAPISSSRIFLESIHSSNILTHWLFIFKGKKINNHFARQGKKMCFEDKAVKKDSVWAQENVAPLPKGARMPFQRSEQLSRSSFM